MLTKNIKKILITGGAGFIGSHMVDNLLNSGKAVTVFDNLSSGKLEFISQHNKNPNFVFVKGDLRNQKNLNEVFKRKFDLIIHLAANPDISKGINDPTLDFKQTIVATFNLLLKMKEKKITRLIYLSGSGVYGDTGSKFTSEDFGPLLPVSMYGASKLSAEALISAFSHLFNIQTWILRPANIIGKHATHGVVFDFINKLRKNPNNLTILGDGNQSKSYLYISDVLDAIWIALTNTNESVNIFNVSSQSYITVNEIAEIAIKELGLQNVKLIHTSGKVGWPGDVPIVRIESKKLYRLGWQPKFNSYEAVKKTVKVLSKE